MKRIMLLTIMIGLGAGLYAQNFPSYVSTAKTSYKAGNLEEAHFALQQMLNEIDVIIGKEVMKLLPQKMDTLQANIKEDNVSANIGFVGATMHRTYGMGNRKAELDIINNSPLIGMLNSFLTNPLFNMGNNGDTKVLKIQGYKARLTREKNEENGNPDYRVEMPFSNALVTFKLTNTSESEIIGMMNTVPFEEIAKLIK
jgi:hypothetical protein